MVYAMVRQVGGGIRLTSELGKGTTVSLYIPRAKDSVISLVSDNKGAATGH